MDGPVRYIQNLLTISHPIHVVLDSSSCHQQQGTILFSLSLSQTVRRKRGSNGDVPTWQLVLCVLHTNVRTSHWRCQRQRAWRVFRSSAIKLNDIMQDPMNPDIVNERIEYITTEWKWNGRWSTRWHPGAFSVPIFLCYGSRSRKSPHKLVEYRSCSTVCSTMRWTRCCFTLERIRWIALSL